MHLLSPHEFGVLAIHHVALRLLALARGEESAACLETWSRNRVESEMSVSANGLAHFRGYKFWELGRTRAYCYCTQD